MKLTKKGRKKLIDEIIEAMKAADGVKLVKYAITFKREYVMALKYIQKSGLLTNEEIVNAAQAIRYAQGELSKEEKRLNKKQLKRDKWKRFKRKLGFK